MTATTVWCASYPKSGNTWVRALLGGLLGDGNVMISNLAGHSSGNDQRAIFREFGISPSVLSDSIANEFMTAVGESVALRSEQPVFRKTHNEFSGDQANASTHALSTPCKALYIVRDPRAVAVSVAHHMGYTQSEAVEMMKIGPIEIAKQKFKALPGFLTEDRFKTRGCQVAFDWGTWSSNVTSWSTQNAVPVLVIKYEDLSADTLGEASRIVEWLELDVSDSTLKEAVESSSFERLAVQEMYQGFVEAASSDRPFFRRGSVDSWREELPIDLQNRVVADHGTVMRKLGYLA